MTGPLTNGEDFAGLDEDLTLTSRGPGRPPKAQEDVRRMRGLRFSDREWAVVCRAAALDGASKSDFVRGAALAASDADFCPHCGAWSRRCNLDRDGQTYCAVTGEAVE